MLQVWGWEWLTVEVCKDNDGVIYLSRYENLLDMAQKKEEGGDPNDDPRKLKPGKWNYEKYPFLFIFLLLCFYDFPMHNLIYGQKSS